MMVTRALSQGTKFELPLAVLLIFSKTCISPCPLAQTRVVVRE